MATVPAEVQGPSDAELIDAVRKGTLDAYGELYARHVASAYNLARQLSRSQAESDDLVSEAFAKVLDTLRAGRGPDSAFRAYLLTALRHTAYDKTRRDRKVELAEDVGEVSGVKPEAVSVPFTDPAVAGLERSLAARAFERLPERWQAVLWHTEIEGQSPAEVAPILGLTPNGVSALAYRAREGLKQAYLQVYLAETTDPGCRTTTDRLGAWTRDGLSKRERAQVEAHLDGCAKCRALAAELRDVNSGLRIFIAPLVLGAGAAGYLATVASTAGITGGAVVAGAAAGTAAGASSGGGAAGAGASLPRQFLGAAGAAAAVAVVVAIALTSGGAKEIPTAQQPPPTAQPPAPTTSPAPTRTQPQPPASSPSQQPPPSPSQPSSPISPAPGAPNLSATPPAVPISLIAGGAPADLPITVTNQGGSPSGPVATTLALPAGVTAVPPGPARLAGAPLLRFDAPAMARLAAATSTVSCPGGTGSVTCRSTTGLAPHDSVILLFRVVAAANSPGGEITGTVSDGTTMIVHITVRVVVQIPPPVLVDGVDVLASAEQFGILLPGLLGKELAHITATNTGTSSKPITLTVDQPGELLSSTLKANCTATGKLTACATGAPVPPGGVVKLTLRLSVGLLVLGCPVRAVTVSATLGSAADSQAVKVECVTLPIIGGLAPSPSKPPAQAPPRPPVKPHLEPGSGPPLPATPAPPPLPLPSTQPAVIPPPGKPLLPPILNWLLPL